jgi:hypothetical protein
VGHQIKSKKSFASALDTFVGIFFHPHRDIWVIKESARGLSVVTETDGVERETSDALAKTNTEQVRSYLGNIIAMNQLDLYLCTLKKKLTVQAVAGKRLTRLH